MQSKPPLCVFLLAACTSASVFAQSADKTDILVGAIDPFQLSRERSKFLQAAGADSVLTEEEHNASAESKNGFIRVYDKWAELLRLDADKDKKIDWAEATQYRQDLRKRVLEQYDVDGNGRLDEAEKAAAATDLAAGKLPKPGMAATTPAPTAKPQGAAFNAPAPASSPNPSKAAVAGSEAEARVQQARLQALEAEKKALAARQPALDGSIDPLLRENMEQAMRTQFARMADEDGDGKLSDAEEANIQKMIQFQMRQDQGRNKLMLKQHDANGNGKIDPEEMESYNKAQMEENLRSMQIMTKYFDADGDGQLSPAEMQGIEGTVEKAMDVNGDGRTTLTEQIQLFETMLPEFDKDGDGVLFGEEVYGAMEAMMSRLLKK